MPQKLPPNDPNRFLLAKVLNLGSVILGLAVLGCYLDQRFHTIPVWTTIGIGLGVLFSFYEAWRIHNED